MSDKKTAQPTEVDLAKELVARYVKDGGRARIHGPTMVKHFVISDVEKKAGEKDDGVLKVVMTTEDVDRHGDVVRTSGVKLGPYRKNKIVLFAHRHDIPAVGKVLKITKEANPKRLEAEVEFAPTALGQELRTLYEGGFMKGWSIGFIPLKWDPIRGGGKDGDGEEGPITGADIKKWELLELSAVPVGANAGALTKAYEDGGEDGLAEFLTQWRLDQDSTRAQREAEVALAKQGASAEVKRLIDGLDGLGNGEEGESEAEMFAAEGVAQELRDLAAEIAASDKRPSEVIGVDLSEWEHRKYICAYCGTPFEALASKVNADDPMCTECHGDGRKAYECGACGSRFMAKPESVKADDPMCSDCHRLVKVQEAQLTGVSLFTCGVCDKEFTAKAESVLADDPMCRDCYTDAIQVFECGECGEAFIAEANKVQADDPLCLPCHNFQHKAQDDNYRTIAFRSYPKQAPATRWDEGAQRRQMEVADLKKGSTLGVKGEEEVKGGYKMLHHTADGLKTNLRAVRAAIGVLNGARGGLRPRASDAVRKAAWNHLARHAREFEVEPAPLRSAEDTGEVKVVLSVSDEQIERVTKLADEAERAEAAMSKLVELQKKLSAVPGTDADPEPEVNAEELVKDLQPMIADLVRKALSTKSGKLTKEEIEAVKGAGR